MHPSKQPAIQPGAHTMHPSKQPTIQPTAFPVDYSDLKAISGKDLINQRLLELIIFLLLFMCFFICVVFNNKTF
jgi:hypothetical protein